MKLLQLSLETPLSRQAGIHQWIITLQ